MNPAAVPRIGAVVNPTSGAGRGAAVWEELRRAEPRLADVRVVQASSIERVREELAMLLDTGIDTLLVLGGDGSIHLAANILLEQGRGDVAIGMVPLGTGVDLPRTLGLPNDASHAVQRVLAARPKPMDVIELMTDDGRRRFVVNVASAGISGPVDAAVNALERPGKTAYLLATLGALRRYQPVCCRVLVDDEPWYEGTLLVLAVANGCSFGRGMRIAPRARVDDGLADVVLVRAVPKWKLPFQLPQLYLGTHLESRYVIWRRGRTVRLEPLGPLPPFDLDGEVFDAAATRFTVLPGALKVLM